MTFSVIFLKYLEYRRLLSITLLKIYLKQEYMKSTRKQQKAVIYCEKWLCIGFDDDIENFEDCSLFLDIYLEEAIQAANDRLDEINSYIWQD